MNDFWNEFGNNRQLRVAATVALGLLSLFLLALTIGAFFALDKNEYPQTSITIDGVGSVTAVPDIASISFTVTEEASTVAAAQDAATKRTDAALAVAKNNGIEDKDVMTSSYAVSTLYTYPNCNGLGTCPPPTVRGYQVSQTVTVKVRDTDTVGTVLQGLGDAGVQNISGPNFTTDDPENLRAEAREKAVADAKEKARALADTLGVSLGRVVGFWENSGDPMPYGGAVMSERAYGGTAMDAAKAPTLPTGENEYEVRVSVTFELK